MIILCPYHNGEIPIQTKVYQKDKYQNIYIKPKVRISSGYHRGLQLPLGK